MPLKGMAYWHLFIPRSTVQGRRMVFCVHTQEWVGLVAYTGLGHVPVRLEGKRMPGEDTLSQVKTRYPEAIIGFHH